MNRTRLLAIATAALGVAVAGIGFATADRAIIAGGAVGAGVVSFGAGYYWYHRQWKQADEVRVDERVEQVTARSGELAFRVSLALAMVVFLALDVEAIPVTPREGVVLLILGMVVARFGLYEWYSRQVA